MSFVFRRAILARLTEAQAWMRHWHNCYKMQWKNDQQKFKLADCDCGLDAFLAQEEKS